MFHAISSTFHLVKDFFHPQQKSISPHCVPVPAGSTPGCECSNSRHSTTKYSSICSILTTYSPWYWEVEEVLEDAPDGDVQGDVESGTEDGDKHQSHEGRDQRAKGRPAQTVPAH